MQSENDGLVRHANPALWRPGISRNRLPSHDLGAKDVVHVYDTTGPSGVVLDDQARDGERLHDREGLRGEIVGANRLRAPVNDVPDPGIGEGLTGEMEPPEVPVREDSEQAALTIHDSGHPACMRVLAGPG